jgi:S-adenosylmethionine:tRNA ribosyltransferase-isomerase
MEPNAKNLEIKDFTYDLPPHRIANFPLAQRDCSKLLVYKQGSITDTIFSNIPVHLPPASLLVLNDTRVIEARIIFTKPSGGQVEIFCLEPFEKSIEEAMQQSNAATWKCLVGGASKWKRGQVLEKHDNNHLLKAKYLDKKEDYFLIKFEWTPAHLPFVQILHVAGAIPLPPYIKRKAEAEDEERYQTVFAKHEGSVAAPTAALHFTPATFAQLNKNNVTLSYVTLHVGAGTFKPVKADVIGDHPMHAEPFTVTKELLTQLLHTQATVAVGTTSLRTLESLYWMAVKLMKGAAEPFVLDQWEAYELAGTFSEISLQQSLSFLINWMEENGMNELQCRTSILIAPGYSFKVVDGLVTNFHQPQSTLLLLIAAFIGNDWQKVYQHALDNDYRFLSYGDSSLLWRNDVNTANR